MQKLNNFFLAMVFSVGALFSTTTYAKPTVVVSVEPLYELVAGLMNGVDKPIVLLKKDELAKNLSNTQVQQLLTADMLIRVGDGLERQLGQSLKHDLKIISNYTLTLSNYLPLLRSGDQLSNKNLTERQQKNDLRFWMDPKLLVMATRYITPQLVRMDPENQEQYLNNEIVLLKQIKTMAQQTAKAVETFSRQEKAKLASFNPYFAHRFLEQKDIDYPTYKIASTQTKQLVCTKKSLGDFYSLSITPVDRILALKNIIDINTPCFSNPLAVYSF